MIISTVSVYISSGKSLNQSLPADVPAIELPKPTGNFAVGTVIYNWTDVTRDDIVTEAADDKRRIIVQIWYPSKIEQGAQRAPYMPELSILRSAFKQGADHLENTRTNAFLQTKLSNAHHKYPVIIFSHGMGVPRSWYTMLMEELASQGYIVAGIDHPYMGLVAMNGKIVGPYPRWTEPPPGGLGNATDEVRDKYWRIGFEQLSADQKFTLDQLAKLNLHDPDGRFTKRLDLKHVGMMGHSMGFVSETCGVDLRFTACLNLEGVPQMNERRSGFRQPYMTMRDGDDSPRMTTVYTSVRNVAYDVLIKGAGHNSYQDPLLAAAYKI